MSPLYHSEYILEHIRIYSEPRGNAKIVDHRRELVFDYLEELLQILRHISHYSLHQQLNRFIDVKLLKMRKDFKPKKHYFF